MEKNVDILYINYIMITLLSSYVKMNEQRDCGMEIIISIVKQYLTVSVKLQSKTLTYFGH